MPNPIKALIKNYRGGIISLTELKSLFFQKLGEDETASLSDVKIPEGILAVLTNFANDFPESDDDLIQIGSCCCSKENCVHTKPPNFAATRKGIEKFSKGHP